MWNYSWDSENRLAVMETTTVARTYGGIPPFRIAFKYDALGRRIQKSVTPGTLYYGNPIYLNPSRVEKYRSSRISVFLDKGPAGPGRKGCVSGSCGNFGIPGQWL